MTMEQILDTLRGFEGVLELSPAPGSEFPEIAWGDHFSYYAADGRLPQREQPYATIVTKDYLDDASSDLDPPGRWRLNVHVSRDRFVELLGQDPHTATTPSDTSEADVLFRHPVYGAQGWLSVVNPGERTTSTVVALLGEAHEGARRRARRRDAAGHSQEASEPAVDEI